jgi:hypothetical protein
VEPLLQFFEFKHLPEHLQVISKEFHTLAHMLVSVLPRNPERTVSLRKLLEAKDSAVRAVLFEEVPGGGYESPFRKANTSARSGMGIKKS